MQPLPSLPLAVALALAGFAGPAAAQSAPANDDCAGAEVVPDPGTGSSVSLYTDLSSTEHATPEAGLALCAPEYDALPGTWYRFTNSTGFAREVEVLGGALTELYVSAFTGPCVAPVPVGGGCPDDVTQAFVGLVVHPGQTVYLLVQPATPGQFALQVTTRFVADADQDGDGWPDGLDLCPTQASSSNADADGDGIGDGCDPEPGIAADNDQPCGAQPIQDPGPGSLGFQYEITGTTVDASPESGLSFCSSTFDSLPGRWYRYTNVSGFNRRVALGTLFTGGVLVSAWTGDCGSLSGFEGNDCPQDATDPPSLSIAPGETVHFLVQTVVPAPFLCVVAGQFAGNPDQDGDDWPDALDLCPGQASSDNGDLDGDGLGNPCDPDRDGDGIDDVSDNCPSVFNPSQLDADRDGIGDPCDSVVDPHCVDDDVFEPNDFCGQEAPIGPGTYGGLTLRGSSSGDPEDSVDLYRGTLPAGETLAVEVAYETSRIAVELDLLDAGCVEIAGGSSVPGGAALTWTNSGATPFDYTLGVIGNDELAGDCTYYELTVAHEAPVPPLTASATYMDMTTGDTLDFAIDFGDERAGLVYLIMGSASGTSPGIDLGPPGTLPLNQDAYTSFLLTHPFAPPFDGFFGVLDADGDAAASITVPAKPDLIGLVLWHAVLVLTPELEAVDVSNAVDTTLGPA